MLPWARRAMGLTLAFAAGANALAQVAAAPAVTTSQVSRRREAAPRVPGISTLFRGFNAGVTYAAVHNSAIGWYSVTTPAVSYSFSQHYSMDASTPLYLHRNVANPNPPAALAEPLVVQDMNAGDTVLGFHATCLPRSLINTTTAYVTLPTGDRSAALGTGRVDFDLSNHTERYYRQIGFLLDLGVGDSAGLFNNQIARDYTSRGALVHFQSGTVLWLPGRSYLETLAYEQLPVGGQTVYSSTGAWGHLPPSPAHFFTTSSAEDNGFTSIAGLPLKDHVTVSGYYNRSLRHHSDTVSFGVTYMLHGSVLKRVDSLVDKALREAERIQ